MKLIVGLGNPGKEYEKTRHNAGFIMIDEFAKKFNLSIEEKKFNGFYTTFEYNGEKIMLLKPQCHMNNSGETIIKFVEYFKIEIADILVIYDDYYIEVGNYKIKANGSAAGHNGLKSIENHLKTQNYKRIKIGISRDPQIYMPDYVLGKFTKEQFEKIEELKTKFPCILEDYLKYTFEKFMSIHN